MDHPVSAALPAGLSVAERFVRSAGPVWALLMLATIVSTWWVSEGSLLSPRQASVAVLVIAMFKVRLVLLYFMELRHAPVKIRLIYEAWLLVVTLLLLTLYLGYWPA